MVFRRQQALLDSAPSLLSALQVTPYNPQQMGQQIFRLPTPPDELHPFVQPNYPHPLRGHLRSWPAIPRDPSPWQEMGRSTPLPRHTGESSARAEAHLPSRKLLERGGGRPTPFVLPCYVRSWRGGGETPGLCSEAVCVLDGAGGGVEPGGPLQGPVRGRSPQSGRKAAVCQQQRDTLSAAGSRRWN